MRMYPLIRERLSSSRRLLHFRSVSFLMGRLIDVFCLFRPRIVASKQRSSQLSKTSSLPDSISAPLPTMPDIEVRNETKSPLRISMILCAPLYYNNCVQAGDVFAAHVASVCQSHGMSADMINWSAVQVHLRGACCRRWK
jgi:hypothetical protein